MGESFIRGGNKVTLEQTPKQSERMSHAAFWGKNILGRENTCKGSEAEVSLGYWGTGARSGGQRAGTGKEMRSAKPQHTWLC